MRKALITLSIVGVLMTVNCGDCDEAHRCLAVSAQIRSEEDIGLAFRALGLQRPSGLQGPLDARIFLTRRAATYGCEAKTHALAQLGVLLLERGRVEEARRVLTESLRKSPTLDACDSLARAYDLLGDPESARAIRVRGEALKGQWDR